MTASATTPAKTVRRRTPSPPHRPAAVDHLAELLWEEHDLARTAAMSLNQLGPAGREVLEAHAEVVPEAREALVRAYRRPAGAGVR